MSSLPVEESRPTKHSTTDALVSPSRLRDLFSPRSVAIVGASDTSGWTRNLLASLSTGGDCQRVVPVHPRHATVHGLRTVPTLRDLDQSVDLAFIVVPPPKVPHVLQDAASAGVHNAVVLASGFAEVGDEGLQEERKLARLARDLDITMLGPNTLGYFNTAANVAPFGSTIDQPLIQGTVGVITQSGALAGSLLRYAQARAIGLSLLVAMGNEAVVTSADVMRYLIEDESTRVIAMFVESFRDPSQFRAAAAAAAAAGKPVVVLKVGRSEITQRAAFAHTGALTGDFAVAEAVMREVGAVSVSSLEELLNTSAVLAHTSRLPAGRRMGVVTTSGGACEVIADRALELGLEVPAFSAPTNEALMSLLPKYAAVHNPLDVTAFEMSDTAGRGKLNAMDTAIKIVAEDPNLDFVLSMVRPLTRDDLDPMRGVAAVIREASVPVFLTDATCIDIAPERRDSLLRHGLQMLGGLDLGLQAVANAIRWSEQREANRRMSTVAKDPSCIPRRSSIRRIGLWAEDEAREYVMEHGVPFPRTELASTPEEAVLAAQRIGYPVALKVCSPDIPHKSDLGGVALDIGSDAEVLAGFVGILDSVADQSDDVRIRGVLVSAMQGEGVELFAAVTADPTFGHVLSVGIGGTLIEVLEDVQIATLPASRERIRVMLGALRGATLLGGFRGNAAANVDAAVEAIIQMTDAAWGCGDALESLEINPLSVNQDGATALDVMLVTRGEEDA